MSVSGVPLQHGDVSRPAEVESRAGLDHRVDREHLRGGQFRQHPALYLRLLVLGVFGVLVIFGFLGILDFRLLEVGTVQIEDAAHAFVVSENFILRQRDQLGDVGQVFFRSDVEHRAAVEEDVADGGDFGPAAAFAVLAELEAEQLAGAAIEARGDRSPAGQQQLVADRHQRTLRGDAGEGVGVVRLLDVDRAIAVVGPDRLAGAGVHGVDEDAHERPNAGREVDGAVHDDRGAARGPRRDQAFVAEDLAIVGPAAEFPDELAGVAVQAVKITVIRGKVDLVFPGYRRETDRTIGKVDPFFRAGARVERSQAVLARRVEEERLAHHDRFAGDVVLHLVLIGPRRLLRRIIA